MKELEDIVTAFDAARQQGKLTALATVVRVEGSSYRRAGARMLVTEDGELTGAISGGCLEGDALRKARLVMAQQRPMLVTYDTIDDDDARLGVGLGCNGIIHILIEPIDASSNDHVITFFKTFLAKRQDVVLVTLFSLADRQATQPGSCMLVGLDDYVARALDPAMELEVKADAVEVLNSGRSVIKEYEQGLTAFIELLRPPMSLIIFGAGNDAIPLVQMAAVLGWHTTVVDGRANYAVPARFPLAKKILIARPEEALPQLVIDSRTAVVLMTHNYNYDLAMLRQLLPLQLTYVGSLGPKKKLQRMLDELEEEGLRASPEQLQSIYGPTGLDIGAETSEEIALSIIAEIQAVIQGRNGQNLRLREGAIYDHNRILAISPNHG